MCRSCYVEIIFTPFVNDLQGIQRSTEKQQELEQQQTDLIGELTKLSDPFPASSGVGTRTAYNQELLPNGTSQASFGQYQHMLSTSSNLSITNASANRTTAGLSTCTALANTTTVVPSLGNPVSSDNIGNAYLGDVASIQVRQKVQMITLTIENMFQKKAFVFWAKNWMP